jgi:hypothetical protein
VAERTSSPWRRASTWAATGGRCCGCRRRARSGCDPLSDLAGIRVEQPDDEEAERATHELRADERGDARGVDPGEGVGQRSRDGVMAGLAKLVLEVNQ